jgi:hypothetical protein
VKTARIHSLLFMLVVFTACHESTKSEVSYAGITFVLPTGVSLIPDESPLCMAGGTIKLSALAPFDLRFVVDPEAGRLKRISAMTANEQDSITFIQHTEIAGQPCDIRVLRVAGDPVREAFAAAFPRLGLTISGDTESPKQTESVLAVV